MKTSYNEHRRLMKVIHEDISAIPATFRHVLQCEGNNATIVTQSGPSGETGRRTGLKILWDESPVWVRAPSRLMTYDDLGDFENDVIHPLSTSTAFSDP